MAMAARCPCGEPFEPAGQPARCPRCNLILAAVPVEPVKARPVWPWLAAGAAAAISAGIGLLAGLVGSRTTQPERAAPAVSTATASLARVPAPPTPVAGSDQPPALRSVVNEQLSGERFDLELLDRRPAQAALAALPRPALPDLAAASEQQVPLVHRLPPLPPERAALYVQVVHRFILYDTGMLSGAEGQKALTEFNALRSDAVPALVDGLNRAAYIRASCPVIVVQNRLRQLLEQSADPALYAYVLEQVSARAGNPVPVNSRPTAGPGARPQPIVPAYHEHQLVALRQFCEDRLRAMALDPQQIQISTLAETLKAKEASRRRQAAVALGARGPDAASAVAALIEVLADEDYEIAGHAGRALAAIGPAAQPALRAAARDANPQVRSLACLALGENRPAAAESLAALIAALADAEPQVQGAAHVALGKIGAPAVPVLLEAIQKRETRTPAALALGRLEHLARGALPVLQQHLAHPDREMREAAHHALVLMGATAVPTLAQSSRDSRPRVWFSALVGLGEIGPRAAEAVPALSGLLESDDPLQRLLAVDALGRIAPEQPELLSVRAGSVPRFVEVLQHPEASLRAWSAAALGRLGPSAGGATPALVKALADESASVRAGAAEALGRIGTDDPAGVAALTARLGDPEAVVRARSAEALGRLGRSAETAVPALIASQVDGDAAVQSAVHAALVGLREVAVPGLLASLSQAKMRPRSAAILAEIGPPAVPGLAEALQHPDTAVRLAAAQTLGEIGPPAKDALPALADALPRGNHSLRVEIVAALARIDPQDSLPVLVQRFEDPAEEVRRAAQNAVVRVGRPAVFELARALQAPSAGARRLAAESLGILADDAADATAALTATLNDPDRTVRIAAANALRDIGPVAAVEALINLFGDPDREVRTAGHLALVHAGREVVPHLVQALRRPEVQVRRGAIETIKKIQVETQGAAEVQAALPHLVACLADSSAEVRDEAAWALEEIVPDFQPILPQLRRAVVDPPRPAGDDDLLPAGRVLSHVPLPELSAALTRAKGRRLRELIGELSQRHGEQVLLNLALACVHADPDGRQAAWDAISRYPSLRPAPAAETAAAAALKLHRQLLDLGNVPRARQRLAELIREHPRTRAAEDARRLLATLPR